MNEFWKQVNNTQITPLATLDSSVINGNAHILCPLSDDSILHLSGPDAEKFLQGQITCDVRQISATQSSMGAACTAKGKMVALFQLVMDSSQNDPGYLLRVPTSTAASFLAHINKYIVFSKASVSISKEISVVGLFAGNNTSIADTKLPEESGATVANGRIILTRVAQHTPLFEVYGTPADLIEFFRSINTPTLASNHATWRSIEIYYGIPRLEITHIDKYVPQNFNLHYLNAISFNKGCYTGQEIVARIKYLGREKKQLRVMQSELANTPPPSSQSVVGAAIENSEHEKTGTVLSCSEIIDGKIYLTVMLNLNDNNHDTAYFTPALNNNPLQLVELSYIAKS
ncbi:MAG: hypothetical protein CSA50_04730 [Gammaproteobacteria bacterium]|nr:MAG: hypothetical protein CSA50_04730 [Gammaproteobacteria bacterium]